MVGTLQQFVQCLMRNSAALLVKLHRISFFFFLFFCYYSYTFSLLNFDCTAHYILLCMLVL